MEINVPADLNFVDDDGMVLARVPSATELRPGAVVVAGTAFAWTWGVVHGVDGGWATLRPVTGRQAAAGSVPPTDRADGP